MELIQLNLFLLLFIVFHAHTHTKKQQRKIRKKKKSYYAKNSKLQSKIFCQVQLASLLRGVGKMAPQKIEKSV